VKILNPDNLRVPTEPGATPCLLGNRCRDCGCVVFPKMPVCPSCHKNGNMEEIEIGRTGKLYSYTISYFAPKGFTAPAFQIFVDLPEGPRIFSLVGGEFPVERGVLEDGMEMRLVVEPLADSAEHKEELTYKYVPAGKANGARA
jgi:uncharacterized OB-fold protein